MNRFQHILLTVLQKLFPPERPSESELIALGYQQALADMARQQAQSQLPPSPPAQVPVYEQPERHTDPIKQLPVQPYRPGRRMHTYNAQKRFSKKHLISPADLETEQVPIIRLKEKQ